jgi:hypothetical protein
VLEDFGILLETAIKGLGESIGGGFQEGDPLNLLAVEQFPNLWGKGLAVNTDTNTPKEHTFDFGRRERVVVG